ncbi:MAG: hypothetical protein J7647_21185 [Cyanobacteria bacterium SBLK]|nr:hypothetical protein [Cyanobacteria bacterium SBLK]
MARINPYTLRMQVTRMFEQGQSMFCTLKVRDWLLERNEDPDEYEIIFHQKPAPPGAVEAMIVEIELKRKDGEVTDPWLVEQVNLYT